MIFGENVFSQETITNLVSNPEIKKLSKDFSKSFNKTNKASYELPFIDDFAKSNGYPDSEKWADNYVFINHTYPINSVSIGVATFDIIDDKGALYTDASINAFGADTLTSLPINLNYPGNNSIFLSFYYEPGGLGDIPEPEDMFYVDYYSPDSAKWFPAWQVSFNKSDSTLTEYYYYNSGYKVVKNTETLATKEFQSVIIPVTEDQYLKDNFQFRFRNKGSLSSTGNTPLVAGNCDQWHIDFVQLDTARNINDTIINDLCFIEPLGSLLNNYESLPWTHFSNANFLEMNHTFSVVYANRSNNIISYANRIFEIEDLLGSTGTEKFTGGSGDQVDPYTIESYERNQSYIFRTDLDLDSAFFEYRGYFEINNSAIPTQYRWNDTIRYLQRFYNYYAYDDGTAENGYDLSGDGTENGMVAMRFKTYKEDTLRGIQVYFNQSLNNSSEKYFKLVVWDEINDKPGNILYIKENIKPVFEDSLNKFTSFIFDTAFAVKNNFYIGWQKIYANSLNIGFDINKNNSDKLFKNYSGSWLPSSTEGTVMIRPMFGEKISIPTTSNNPISKEKFDFNLFPNPATNNLTIELNAYKSNEIRYTIFDINGKVYLDNYVSESSIDISGLSSGIFFIRLSNINGQYSSKKFVVIR